MYQIVHQVYTDVDSGVTSCHGSVPILVDTLLIDMTSVFHGTFHWSSDFFVFSHSLSVGGERIMLPAHDYFAKSLEC